MVSKPTYAELEQMVQMYSQAFEFVSDAVFVNQLEADGFPGHFINVNKEENQCKPREAVTRGIAYTLDQRGCFTSVGPAIEKVMGYTPREIVGRPLEKFIYPDDRSGFRACLAGVLKNMAMASTYRILDDAGRVRWVYLSMPAPIEKKAVGEMQGILHYVPDRNIIEEMLRESEIHFKPEKKKAADELQFNQKLLRKIMDIVPAYICAKDLDGKFLLVNRKLADFYGMTIDEMTGDYHRNICEDKKEIDAMLAADREVISNGQPKHIPEETMVNPDGCTFVLETYKIPFKIYGTPAVLVVANDITDRKHAEQDRDKLAAQFRQAQKLESIGRLAGGVAHDLNNLLSPILGYGDMLLEDLDGHDSRKASVEQIIQAGLRARDIVHQLLAFSRKQALEFKPVDLNKVLIRFEKLLRRTIREDIDIRLLTAAPVPLAYGDIGQLEQVIMNLAVNAQDAMPEGGTLTFETFSAELDEDYAAVHEGVKPGRYAMLCVNDTGGGMDARICKHLFEPFFSTKGKRGTGLGLATVYGIVKQHGGSIWVYSEIGQGTTFKVYLPASTRADAPMEKRVRASLGLKGSGTVLIVEDNQPVRALACEVLKRQGYDVLTAGDGKQALAIFDQHGGPVYLLLTDVVMPKLNGKELFQRISAVNPGVKVLYMSGYTDDVIVHRGVLDKGVNFIQKPFTVRGLSCKVREILATA